MFFGSIKYELSNYRYTGGMGQKMSKKDLDSFIKNMRDCEWSINNLIIKQQVSYDKLLSDLKVIRNLRMIPPPSRVLK